MAPVPSLTAAAGMVMNASTGVVVWSKDASTQRAMASTTKVMTLLLMLEYDADMSDLITISSVAASTGGSTADVSTGEVYTSLELAYGLMLPSGNDAAIAVAEHFGQTYLGAATASAGVTAFVARMNARAAELGLTGTQFKSPHGLDATGHYSTPLDLCNLLRVVFALPLAREITGTASRAGTPQSGAVGDPKEWLNTLHLLGEFQVTCGKTGTTSNAGSCLVAQYDVAGHSWVCAVLGAANNATRMDEAIQMLEYARDLVGAEATLSGVSTTYHSRTKTGWSSTSYLPATYLNGYGIFSSTVGHSFTYQFWGTAVSIIAPRSSSRGILGVSLDGGTVEYADQYAASLEQGATVYSASGLEDGPHTLVLTVTGEKSAASSGTVVALDEFHTTRAIATPVVWDDVATLGAVGTYTDTAPPAGFAYEYRVVATNGSASTTSNTATAEVPA